MARKKSGDDWALGLTGRARPAISAQRIVQTSPGKAMKTDAVNAGHLRAFLERVERLEEEKRALSDDIKDVYAEAKGNGFDVRIMRKIVSIRRQDNDKRREEEEILDLYLSALGMR
jgi:uncharacterized protein (UPF0335 family)